DRDRSGGRPDLAHEPRSHPTRLPGTPLLVTKSSQTAEGHRRSSPHQRIRPNSVARVRSETTALAVTLDDSLMRDAESVPDPGPGHALGAGFGDGDLGMLRSVLEEAVEIVETGLSVSEGGITLSPAESGDVIERGGIGAHRAPPPITEATTAH